MTTTGWIAGDRIRALRRATGLTQEEFARTAGLSGPHLSGIERGIRQPAPPTARRIAQALGVPLTDLMTKEDA